MADWVKEFNFRASSTYVTDGTNQTYVLAQNSYPTTRNGVNFGWDAGMPTGNDRNRSTSVDVRLAGINFVDNTPAQQKFRVDLPASGDYDIGLALGDNAASHPYTYIQVLDDTTAKFTIDDTNGQGAARFLDAVGAEYLAADWPSSNTKVQHNFATTTLFLVAGSPTAQSDSTMVTHLSLTNVDAAGGVTQTITAGAMNLTAQSFNTNAQKKETITAGSIGWAGQALTVIADTVISITTGILNWSAQVFNINASTNNAINSGLFNWAAQVFSVKANTKNTIAAGVFNWVGQPLAIVVNYIRRITAVSFNINGKSVSVSGIVSSAYAVIRRAAISHGLFFRR